MPLVNFGALAEDEAKSIQIPKCNREACDEWFAPCFNRGTKTYYCVACARDINFAPAWDGKYLCEIPERSKLGALEATCFAGAQYVGDRKIEDLVANDGIHKGFLARNYHEQIEELKARGRFDLSMMDFVTHDTETGRVSAVGELKTNVPKGGFRRGDFVVVGASTGKGASLWQKEVMRNMAIADSAKFGMQVIKTYRDQPDDCVVSLDRLEGFLKFLLKRDQQLSNKRKKQARARTGGRQ
jgi:hypothetical protein